MASHHLNLTITILLGNARKFMERYPEHDGFFRTRKQISDEHDATNLPELTPEYYAYSET